VIPLGTAWHASHGGQIERLGQHREAGDLDAGPHAAGREDVAEVAQQSEPGDVGGTADPAEAAARAAPSFSAVMLATASARSVRGAGSA
jgi:hypothetical protein